MKFQKFYNYVEDYLNGLSGFNLNFKNKKIIFYGNKTNLSLKELVNDNFIEENKDKNNLVIKENIFLIDNIENSLCSNFLKRLNFFNFQFTVNNPYDSQRNIGN